MMRFTLAIWLLLSSVVYASAQNKRDFIARKAISGSEDKMDVYKKRQTNKFAIASRSRISRALAPRSSIIPTLCGSVLANTNFRIQSSLGQAGNYVKVDSSNAQLSQGGPYLDIDSALGDAQTFFFDTSCQLRAFSDSKSVAAVAYVYTYTDSNNQPTGSYVYLSSAGGDSRIPLTCTVDNTGVLTCAGAGYSQFKDSTQFFGESIGNVLTIYNPSSPTGDQSVQLTVALVL